MLKKTLLFWKWIKSEILGFDWILRFALNDRCAKICIKNEIVKNMVLKWIINCFFDVWLCGVYFICNLGFDVLKI